jgi:phosphoglycerate dehydrogenase-like enzyme
MERDGDVLAQALDGAWATVAGGEHYTRGLLGRLRDLRVIARVGVGYESIDVEAATEHGVLVLITPGANAEHVADFTLALMLGCLRRLVEADAAVRSGAWRLPVLSGDLAGAAVGVVGLGHIGRAVVRRLSGFGCRLLAVEPRPDLEFCRRYAVEVRTLDELLSDVDVLSLHVPLTPETEGLLGARELARVRPGVVVVNTARGGLLDEAALVAALADGRVGAAGLDVFAHEPLPAGHPLTSFPGVLLGGRTSTFTRASMAAMTGAVVENILGVDRGEIPVGCVNPAAVRPETSKLANC